MIRLIAVFGLSLWAGIINASGHSCDFNVQNSTDQNINIWFPNCMVGCHMTWVKANSSEHIRSDKQYYPVKVAILLEGGAIIDQFMVPGDKNVNILHASTGTTFNTTECN